MPNCFLKLYLNFVYSNCFLCFIYILHDFSEYCVCLFLDIYVSINLYLRSHMGIRQKIVSSSIHMYKWHAKVFGHLLKSHNFFQINPNDLCFFKKLEGLVC